MRFLTILTVLATLGLTTACTDDDPVDAGFGTASAAVSDDASSASAYRAPQGSALTAADGHFSGSFSSSAEVEISADGETWVELGSPSSVTLNLQSDGEETTIHSNASIPVGTYTRVRLTLSGAAASIDAGASLGGITFTGAIDLAVGGSDQEVVIEKEVQPFTVDSDTRVRILFDLNSELWVNEENAEDEEVEDAEVQDSADGGREFEEEQV